MISREQFPRQILTNRGVVDIQDVLVGDYVYEWNTCNHLEVKAIRMIPYSNMYKVTYSDGRVEYHSSAEPLYLDRGIYPPHHPFCKCLKTKHYPIHLYPTIFDKNIVKKPLNPDPYVAGALLMYGDQDDPYLNWPLNRTEANNNLGHKYNIEYYPGITDGKAYFMWNGKVPIEKITWKEFFKDSEMYATTDGRCEKYIPDEYLYSSYEDRRQFIRGVFDMGYIEWRSQDRVAIFHNDLVRLEAFRPMLWSMGFKNNIYRDESAKDGKEYRLEIDGIAAQYPGFFYHRTYIENMIDSHYRPTYNMPITGLTVVDIEALEDCSHMYHNPMPHIVLERPHMIYTSPNFIPRVSI